MTSKTISIRKIIKEWSSYKIPTIQRGFVWNEERIKDFFESIIKGYPVGSIILWHPKDEFPHVPLCDSNTNAESDSNVYILDGQQRLTSIFLAYHNWEITRNGGKIEVNPIYYNPNNETFFISSSKNAPKMGVNLSLILKAFSGDSKAYREIMEKYGEYYENLNEIASKILDYEIPYYKIEKNIGYDEVAEIFVKVNSAGVKIDNMHMFFSLFVGGLPHELSDVKNMILEIYKKYDAQFRLKFETILRFIFHNLGAKQNQITDKRKFKKAISDVWDKYKEKPDEIRNVILDSGDSTDLALKFLENELGLVRSEFIPSQNALLPLFKYFYVNRDKFKTLDDIPEIEKKKLAKWFILSSYAGRYSKNSKIEQDINIIKDDNFTIDELIRRLENEDNFTIDRFMKDKNNFAESLRVQGRKYMMLLMIALFKNNARDWILQNKSVVESVKNRNYHKHHIFPKEYLSEFDITEKDLVDDIGNITIINKIINESISSNNPKEYLQNYRSYLAEHFIPENEELWTIKKFEEFLKQRREKIYDTVYNFYLR